MTLDRWKLLFPIGLFNSYRSVHMKGRCEGHIELLRCSTGMGSYVSCAKLESHKSGLLPIFRQLVCIFLIQLHSICRKMYIYYVLIVFLLLCWHGKDGLISPRVGTALEHLPCLFSCHPTCRAHQVSIESFGVGIMLCFCWLANSTRQSFYYKWLLGVDLNVDKEACGSI
jgi:hypothetical protein